MTIIRVPNLDRIHEVLTTTIKACENVRKQHQHGLITEQELAEKSVDALATAINALANCVQAAEGSIPEHPWPIGTSVSVLNQGVGVVLADVGDECCVRLCDRDITIPTVICIWDWPPTSTTRNIAQYDVWPPAGGR